MLNERRLKCTTDNIFSHIFIDKYRSNIFILNKAYYSIVLIRHKLFTDSQMIYKYIELYNKIIVHVYFSTSAPSLGYIFTVLFSVL